MAEFYDIDLNFNVNAKGDIALVEDNDAILQSIRSIILTPRGFKTGTGDINRIFGVGIKSYLFAPLTEFTARSLGENIVRNLTMFEPRIDVENVFVQVNRDTRAFEIEVNYVLAKTDEEFTFRTIINQL
jgi:phage baseplate assembly protein W